MDTHRKPGLLVDGAPNRRVTRNILLTEEALLSGLWVSKKETLLRGKSLGLCCGLDIYVPHIHMLES